MEKMLAERGEKLGEARLALFRKINARHWEMLEDGTLTRPEVLVGRFRVFFAELGLDYDAESAEDSYGAHLCEGHYFVPGAVELLEGMYDKCDIYIISNGNARVQDARLKSSGIGRYFKDIFISENMGCDKPSREYFDLCISRIPDFDSARTLVIGDSLTSDIRGGINAGLKTCWFNPKGNPARADIVPDYTVSSLAELPALVARLFGE